MLHYSTRWSRDRSRAMINRMSDAADSKTARVTFEHALRGACDALMLPLEEDQVDRMWRHYILMVVANRTTNLTRITAADQAAVKHYADSLALIAGRAERFPPDVRLLDVGTGAGFPAVPLAICKPDWRITAIDSTAKKVAFVGRAAEELELDGLTVRHVRARELADQVNRFDVVTCRATGDLLKCLRETRRLVTSGGWLVCYTTPSALDAMQAATHRQGERLGFALVERSDYELLLGAEQIGRALALWQRR
jgi:16S rRNA (guanine527-N7)-methyltransferase